MKPRYSAAVTNGEAAFLVCAASAVGYSVYGLVRARRSGKASEAAWERQLASPRMPIAEAPAGDSVCIRGRVTPSTGDPILTPFSGQPALWVKSSFQNNIGQSRDEWVEHVDAVDIDDGSGKIATVPLAGAVVRAVENQVEGNGPRVQGVTATRNPGRSVWPYESLILPGDAIEVTGPTLEDDGEYRSEPRLRFSDSQGAVQIARIGDEGKMAADAKRNAGCATFALVVSSVVFAIALVRTLLQ